VHELPRTSLFVHLNGETKGPFTTEQLEALVSVHAVTGSTLCCHDGAENWLTVADYVAPPIVVPPVISPPVIAAASNLSHGGLKGHISTIDN
jgi:hypothetical protein